MRIVRHGAWYEQYVRNSTYDRSLYWYYVDYKVLAGLRVAFAIRTLGHRRPTLGPGTVLTHLDAFISVAV